MLTFGKCCGYVPVYGASLGERLSGRRRSTLTVKQVGVKCSELCTTSVRFSYGTDRYDRHTLPQGPNCVFPKRIGRSPNREIGRNRQGRVGMEARVCRGVRFVVLHERNGKPTMNSMLQADVVEVERDIDRSRTHAANRLANLLEIVRREQALLKGEQAACTELPPKPIDAASR